MHLRTLHFHTHPSPCGLLALFRSLLRCLTRHTRMLTGCWDAWLELLRVSLRQLFLVQLSTRTVVHSDCRSTVCSLLRQRCIGVSVCVRVEDAGLHSGKIRRIPLALSLTLWAPTGTAHHHELSSSHSGSTGAERAFDEKRRNSAN